MTVSDKLIQIKQAKEAIRAAIVAKGATLPIGSPLNTYAAAINGISTGPGTFDLLKLSDPSLKAYTNNYTKRYTGLKTSLAIDRSVVHGRNLFYVTDVTTVIGLNNDLITNMADMFSGNTATDLSILLFDTKNVTSMNSMFYSCSASKLDLSSFDTGKVTDMNMMFNSCSALRTLDISSWVFLSDVSLTNMFKYTGNLVVSVKNSATKTFLESKKTTMGASATVTFVVKP